MTTGYIGTDGKYHRGEEKKLAHDVNSTFKEYSHEIGRKEYSKAIIQPHENGKPSKKFIEAYPDISKEYWDQATIDKTLREI